MNIGIVDRSNHQAYLDGLPVWVSIFVVSRVTFIPDCVRSCSLPYLNSTLKNNYMVKDGWNSLTPTYTGFGIVNIDLSRGMRFEIDNGCAGREQSRSIIGE